MTAGMTKVNGTGDTFAAEVAYENTADEAWARRVLDLYRRRELQVGAFDTERVVSAWIWGTYPRCGHEPQISAGAIDTAATVPAFWDHSWFPGLRPLKVSQSCTARQRIQRP
jgi:hypothetical protein